MELGDPAADQRIERGPLDLALDAFDDALNGLIETIETGGLDQLDSRSEGGRMATVRNLSATGCPLIDHSSDC